ncbi:carboxypeptidase family protein [Archangium gephyra]|uniref:Carboxypeptidase family protein n=1 Tax=Archangium gephyra TaxID=48 RepID=A0ABX9JQN6_9BACT|nr:TonB-dependent receptor [Archangium gephyra]REG24548.1 carboxypeptidase family protein [Archangium gephyra]
MSSHVRLARAWCVLLLLLGSSAWAQGTAVITGKIINSADKKPLQDAVVTATSPSLQGEQTVVSDASGQYRIPQLPPGTYTIRVDMEGFRPFSRGDIQLRLDRTIRFNVEMLPEGGLSEEITVTAAPPTVDVGSSASGLNIDAAILRNLAVSRPGSKGSASRSFESLAEMAPGAQEDTYGVSINGGTSPENQFVVDGLSVNDPAVGTIGTPLSVEFVKEVNVITGGYMPEYGRSTGGVMNVVTKSGSNEFHGSVFGNVAPGVLQTAGPVIQQAGSVISAQGKPWNQGDFGFELGGPILKDKLWFYAGVAPSFNRIQVSRQLSVLDICTAKDDANGCSAVGAARIDPKTRFQIATPIEGARTDRFADERTVQYIGKLTYHFNQDHNLSLSVYGTPTWSGGAGRYSFSRDGAPEVCSGLSCTAYVQGAYEAIATQRTGGAMDIVAKQASSFFDKKLLVDATVGWHHQNASTLPTDGSGLDTGVGLSAQSNIAWRRSRSVSGGKTVRDYHSITEFEQLEDPSVCDSPAGMPAGMYATRCPVASYASGGPGTISISSLDRYQGKAVATYLLEALGHHVVKAGIDAEGASFYNKRARTGGTPWQECTSGACFFTLNQYGYLDGPDTIVPLPFKEGTSTSATVGGFVQDSWSIMDKVTVNVGVRYDSQTIWGLDGKRGLNLPNQWSPRVGVIYDFTQQGRSKLFVNYARFYENVPLDMADLSFPQQQLLSATYNAPKCDPRDPADLAVGGDCNVNSNRQAIGNPENPNQFWSAEGGDRVPVDPNIRAQSSDEFVLGAEYEVLLGRVGLSYTKRYLNDVIEDMSRDDGTTFFLGNPGKGFSTDFPLARRDYDAVNAYYTKSFSDGWLAQVSYTWSSLRGNYSGLFRADTGQISPNLTRDFDLLSLTVNRDGPLPGDRTHAFKVFGAKEFRLAKDLSLDIGGGWRSRSGAPLNYLGFHPRRSGAETFILPRGSAGRLPWVHNTDGHLGVTKKLAGNYALSLSVDVFNIFNFQEVTARDQVFTTTRVHPIEVNGKPADLEACRTDSPSPDCRVYVTTAPLDKPVAITNADINPNFKKPIAYQAPRSIRFGMKLSF